MQTALADFIKDTPEGREADAILRACVHCGFCNATCPTYQLLGDELDGPRGRIYLIKQILEGGPATARTQLHLDRCLTCRACETTCPSGVRYGRLADIGRHVVEQRVRRLWHERLTRWLLRSVLPYRSRFTPLLMLGRAVRPLLPGTLRRTVPPAQAAGFWPAPRHQRRMLVLEGCVQPGLAPRINAATARVLDHLGISLVRADSAGCCGAVSHHLSAQDEALDFMRRNIDAWWPHVEAGVEALVMTASGCGVMVKEYGQLLSHDPRYAAKATRIAELTRDIAEILADTELSVLQARPRKIAFQSPCTLQHGQKLGGVVERLLRGLGFELTPVPDAHLCCGSAGTYSILQGPLSQRLLANKLEALESGRPELIATANIGCLVHLQSRTRPRVVHWIELLDKA
ncbi:MAG: glycolate oxidase subunit GlcF [Nitrospira sp.]|nr:glycolate oxidase subunit GlcF [Nitrospira sp.]